MTPYDLYKDAKLDEAIEQAVQDVKSKPTDINARLMLCDLLCMASEFERADKQLDILVKQDSELSVGVSLYRQLIRAEIARSQFYEQGRLPEFMEDVSEVLKLHLRASIAIREGSHDEASELIDQAEELRTPITGTCDGETFNDFRDLDDLTSPFLEILTSTGKYYWVGMDKIQSLEFKELRQLRDLIWRPASMEIENGPDAVIYIPVLYADSVGSDDPQLRIGLSTDWIQHGNGPTRGIGQRTFLVDGDQPDEDKAKSILSIQNIAMNRTAEPTA